MKKKDPLSLYQVFGALPDFIREHRILDPEQETPPVPDEPPLSQNATPVDDQQVFLDAMKDVKKIDRRKSRVRRADKGNTVPLCREKERGMEETLAEDYSFNVINLPEYMEGYIDGMNPLIMDKLRNGEYSVQKVLDLHGYASGDACEAFVAFIRDSVQSQVHCVKVIHGRGLKSKRGPVLKEKLKGWIVRAIHRKWVVAFSNAKMADGGPGATVILLRTRAHKKKLHIIG
jgi:DNA-nicking Smr family endonuclease